MADTSYLGIDPVADGERLKHRIDQLDAIIAQVLHQVADTSALLTAVTACDALGETRMFRVAQVPEVGLTLPIACPRCHRDVASFAASSRTILTVTCAACAHAWALEIVTMPEPVRVASQLLMLRREHQNFDGR